MFLKKVCKMLRLNDLSSMILLHLHWLCLCYKSQNLKNNILTLLLLTIMTKNHSCYWSFLVWHFHFSWLCGKLILLSVSFSCQKLMLRKVFWRKSITLVIFKIKLSNCKQHSHVEEGKKKTLWINGWSLVLLETC